MFIYFLGDSTHVGLGELRPPLGILAKNPAELRMLRRSIVAAAISGAATAVLVPIIVQRFKGTLFQVKDRPLFRILINRPTLLLEKSILAEVLSRA